MPFQLTGSPPSQTETFEALAELKALKTRFGCYDEHLNALLEATIERFVASFGDDDWQDNVAPAWVRDSALRKLVAG